MAASQSVKLVLNQIEQPIAIFLKTEGFRKNGRTFNRETEKGIIQVINLQSGLFPVGENYTIPGFRESKYGQFTVNLGIGVDEIQKLTSPKAPIKSIWKEYDCTIRIRLASLLYSKDHWWDITKKSEKTASDIIEGLKKKGLPWLNMFDSRKKICENFTTELALRADLDVALITFYLDKEKGVLQLQDYYDRQGSNLGHKNYVADIATSMGVILQTN
jgi:Domain of unknown function (DUF4304)